MKKTITCLIALILCIGLILPVSATESAFVPSVTYKDGPVVEDAVMNGETVKDCVVVTTVKQAEEKTTDIYQEERDILVEVYEKVSTGAMVIPVQEGYVVRELVDVSFAAEECVEPEHKHEEELEKEEVTQTVSFALGVDPGVDVQVMVFFEEEWIPVDTVNNGDGTITCVFEVMGPVAFAVPDGVHIKLPQTGDTSRIGLWLVIMLLALVGIVITILYYRKKSRRKHRK